MAEHEFRSTDTKAGTIGGLLFALLLRINGQEVVQTMLFSAVGAAVSFTVSVVLRWAFKKLRN